MRPSRFQLYNTLSRETEDFIPREPGHIGLYVCGMTVYDNAHVGHARSMVVYDAFVRWLRANHWNVTFVRNFTENILDGSSWRHDLAYRVG